MCSAALVLIRGCRADDFDVVVQTALYRQMPSGQQTPPAWLRPLLIAIPIVYSVIAFGALILEYTVSSLVVAMQVVGVNIAVLAFMTITIAVDIICFRFRRELQSYIERTAKSSAGGAIDISYVSLAVRRLTIQLVAVNLLLLVVVIGVAARTAQLSASADSVRASSQDANDESNSFTLDQIIFAGGYLLAIVMASIATPPDFLPSASCCTSNSNPNANSAVAAGSPIPSSPRAPPKRSVASTPAPAPAPAASPPAPTVPNGSLREPDECVACTVCNRSSAAVHHITTSLLSAYLLSIRFG